MNTFIERPTRYARTCAALFVSALLIAGCATGPESPEGAAEVRSKLTALKNDPDLASRAQVEIRKAEEAVELAEEPLPDAESDLASHRILMADRRVEIARARAATKLAEDRRTELDENRTDARLQARTREADRAHEDAASARRSEAQMQRRLEELEAEETERGMVVTLGDVLFDTGSAQLRGNADSNLNKLAEFMQQYPDVRVLIEGHTDNVGSAAYNQRLSQQRAESVKQHLTRNGIGSRRISVSGIGLQRPIASNDTVSGRQQNRRVEIIIEDSQQASSSGGQQ